MYRYADAPFMSLEPRESIACVSTEPPSGVDAAGVTNVNDSGVRPLIVVGVPPNSNVVSDPKSKPLTVTVCPPTTGPDDGVNEVIDGPVTVSWLMRVFQQAWMVLQTPTTDPSSDPDTTHTSLGFAGSWAAPE